MIHWKDIFCILIIVHIAIAGVIGIAYLADNYMPDTISPPIQAYLVLMCGVVPLAFLIVAIVFALIRLINR